MEKYHICIKDNESGEVMHEGGTNLFAFAGMFGEETARMLGIHTQATTRAEAATNYINIIVQLQLLSKNLLESVKNAVPFFTDETVRNLVESACEELEKEDEHAES